MVFQNTRNSLARSDDNIVAAVIGLDNVIVVATSDAVLVTSRDRAEGRGARHSRNHCRR